MRRPARGDQLGEPRDERGTRDRVAAFGEDDRELIERCARAIAPLYRD